MGKVGGSNGVGIGTSKSRCVGVPCGTTVFCTVILWAPNPPSLSINTLPVHVSVLIIAVTVTFEVCPLHLHLCQQTPFLHVLLAPAT